MRTLLFLLKLADRISVPRVKEICVLNSRSLSCSNTERKSSRSFISNTFPFLRFSTSAEIVTGWNAKTTQLVSLVLHRKDIDVSVLQVLRANTVRTVTMSLLTSCFKYHLVQISLNVKHSGVEAEKFEDPALNAVALKIAYF